MVEEVIILICDILVSVAIVRCFFFFNAIGDYVYAIIMLNSKQCPLNPSWEDKIDSIIKKATIWLGIALSVTILRSGLR